MEVICLAFSP